MADFRYDKVKRLLAEEISRNRKPGDRLPALKELARIHDVSRNTIQRAVDDLVAEQVLTKRRGSGIYVADPQIKPLRLGFIYPWTMQQLHSFQWHHDLILHIEEAITKLGHELIVSCNIGKEADAESPDSFLRSLQTFDGVLFFNMCNNRIIQDTLALDVPVVLLHHVQPIYNVDRIEADGAGGVSMAAQHLIGLGHRRIGFVTDRYRQNGRRHMLFETREEGWRETMREAGLACDSSLILQAPPADWDDACKRNFEEMALGLDPVTAFICINDISASYLYKGIHSLGLRVPDDVSVVGCENTPLSDLLSPRITSIHIPQARIAHFAVERLIQTIHSGQSDRMMSVFRTRLIVKESTGKCKYASKYPYADGISSPALISKTQPVSSPGLDRTAEE